MKDRKIQETLEAEKKKDFQEGLKSDLSMPEKAEDHRSRLERLIPEFYVNQKTLSDDSEGEADNVSHHSEESSQLSELDEKQKNALFDRMKTRNNFYSKNSFNNSDDKNTNSNGYNNNKEKSDFEIYNYKENINTNKSNKYNGHLSKYDKSSKNFVLPFLPTKVHFAEKGRSQTQTQNSPVREGSGIITDLDIKNAAASSLYRTKIQPLSLIETDPTILNIKKIREKFKIIKEMDKKKERVIGVDLFKYDKKKWQKKNLREVN